MFGPSFGNARYLDIAVDATEQAFHVIVTARTSGLVPFLATIGAFAIGLAVHASALVAPLIGGGVGLLAWAQEWWEFNLGVLQLGDRCDAALGADGRLTRT
jgi:hypothetical protein